VQPPRDVWFSQALVPSVEQERRGRSHPRLESRGPPRQRFMAGNDDAWDRLVFDAHELRGLAQQDGALARSRHRHGVWALALPCLDMSVGRAGAGAGAGGGSATGAPGAVGCAGDDRRGITTTQ